MTRDARFEDGATRALKLIAQDKDDLDVISTLTQDAVFPGSEIAWNPGTRRFAMLLNRFRWEAPASTRAPERVQSVLAFDDVTHVSSQGLQRGDPDTILSILALSWHAGEDGTGRIEITLAGDGAIALDVECVNATLQDVTRNYLAPSGKAPHHPQ